MGLGLPKWFSGKEQHANAGDARDKSSVPGSGRFPEVGDGKPLQSTYLENPMDRGTWWTIVPWSRKESNMTEWLNTIHTLVRCVGHGDQVVTCHKFSYAESKHSQINKR